MVFIVIRVADKFVLSFNAANVTGNPMVLHCAVYQSPLNGVLSDTVTQTLSWGIDGSCSKRVRLELKKFSLPEEKNASQQNKVEKYSNYLVDMVRMTWKCVSFSDFRLDVFPSLHHVHTVSNMYFLDFVAISWEGE